jgi:hypothetical protein
MQPEISSVFPPSVLKLLQTVMCYKRQRYEAGWALHIGIAKFSTCETTFSSFGHRHRHPFYEQK